MVLYSGFLLSSEKQRALLHMRTLSHELRQECEAYIEMFKVVTLDKGYNPDCLVR